MAGDPQAWMFAQALEALARAEEMRRQFFRLQRAGSRAPNWEPPVDVFETEAEVVVIIALPGVDPAEVDAIIDGGHLVVAGRRSLPAGLRNAVIHRMELPQGRFERRVPLPAGHYGKARVAAGNGCLLITLQKTDLAGGRP